MRLILSFFLIAFVIGCSQADSANNKSMSGDTTKVGKVEQWAKELSNVMNPDAQPEIIGQGFEWSEGPVWVQKHQFLLFSDVPHNKIFRWDAENGITTYLSPSGYTGNENKEKRDGSNGLIIDEQGRLVLTQHGDRRLARMKAPLTDPASRFETLADRYEGKRFNSPNDVVQHSSGALYFTDPPYGLPNGVEGEAREIDFQGVYRVDTNGTVTLLVDSLSRPNGLAFSPDEEVLYVANSDSEDPIWMAYDVEADGSLANGRVFFDASKASRNAQGLPDGMKVDADGYIYATGPGGVWIFTPEGTKLGRIRTGQRISNCAIGNRGSMLYMTANDYLMRIPLR